jgi:hypothetical protein
MTGANWSPADNHVFTVFRFHYVLTPDFVLGWSPWRSYRRLSGSLGLLPWQVWTAKDILNFAYG